MQARPPSKLGRSPAFPSLSHGGYVPFCPWRQKGTERAPPKGSRPLETYVTFMFLFDRTYTRRRFAIFAPQIPAETNISKRRQTQPQADARP